MKKASVAEPQEEGWAGTRTQKAESFDKKFGLSLVGWRIMDHFEATEVV